MKSNRFQKKLIMQNTNILYEYAHPPTYGAGDATV